MTFLMFNSLKKMLMLTILSKHLLYSVQYAATASQARCRVNSQKLCRAPVNHSSWSETPMTSNMERKKTRYFFFFFLFGRFCFWLELVLHIINYCLTTLATVTHKPPIHPFFFSPFLEEKSCFILTKQQAFYGIKARLTSCLISTP